MQIGPFMKDFNQFLDHLKTLVSYKTTLGKPSDGAPFGEENKKALDFFLSLANSFGFETINYDGYIGEVVYGKGKEIGIIGHLDVVPSGEGWATDPFALTEKDGIYYGRGVSDDKTPLLQCLYALKELKDQGVSPNCKFRLIVGLNEESGWKDVEYFNTKAKFPEYGFSPDGDFPLSYAEKGMTEIEFYLPKFKNFSNVCGGTVVNAVCAKATATFSNNVDKNILEKHGLCIENDHTVTSFGVSAHGSSPHLGKNAIKPLFNAFMECGEDLKEIYNVVFNDSLGITKLSNEQGSVTLSAGLISEDDEKITLTCDCRIPAPLCLKDVTDLLDKTSLNYKTFTRHEPVMVEKDGWFVQTLLNAYNSVTGENGKPLSMGGSTFARAFKKGCAFGPAIKSFKNDIHNANEKISKELLLTNYEIYKKAIFDFAKNI